MSRSEAGNRADGRTLVVAGGGIMRLASTREHDLPPSWDGCTVEWIGWYVLPPAIICPRRPASCCTFCGSLTPHVANRGVRRVVEGRSRLMPPLWAFRCPDCSRDTVWDAGTDEWWDLDASDYGDDGSVAP